MAVRYEKRVSPAIKLSINFTEGRDGFVVAECPDVPGCISQGRTREEALENLEDVLRTCLALIVQQWIKNAQKEMTAGPEQVATEEKMVITFVREEVA